MSELHEKIVFVEPAKHHENAAEEYVREHFDAGEKHLHGSSGYEGFESYSVWLNEVLRAQSKETVREGWVSAHTFWAVREKDSSIVGIINLRHELNDFLTLYGGHIGYGVRPSERKKGYAAQMLHMALDFYREHLNTDAVLLTCDIDNETSKRTILKNGGVFDGVAEGEGEVVERYWIKL